MEKVVSITVRVAAIKSLMNKTKFYKRFFIIYRSKHAVHNSILFNRQFIFLYNSEVPTFKWSVFLTIDT